MCGYGRPGAFEPFEAAFPEIEERVQAKAKTLANADADERHVFVWIESPHQSHGTYNVRTEDVPCSTQLLARRPSWGEQIADCSEVVIVPR
jgi:hypothetical protein